MNHKLRRQKSLLCGLAPTLVVVIFLLFPVLPLALAQTLETTVTLQCAAVPSGLVSWWPGDGSAEDIRDSNPGTLVNGATFAAGKVGQAFSFDGVDDRVSIADNGNLDFVAGQSFSVDYWVKSTGISPPAIMFVINKISGGIQPGYASVILPDGRVIFSIADGVNEATVTSTGTVLDGNFHHVTGVRDTTAGQVLVYIDGALDTATVDLTGSLANSLGLIIGARDPSVSPIQFFNGLIDEVEIYNTALTASQIQAIFNAGTAGKCRGGAVGAAVNPNTNRVYVSGASATSTSSGTVSVIQDSLTGLPTTIPVTILVGSEPTGIAVNPITNRLYVASFGSSTVSVIDVSPTSLTQNTVIATLTVASAPTGIAVNPNTNRVYVIHLGTAPFGSGNTVSVIQDSSTALPSLIPVTLIVGNGPTGVDINPNTNRIFVASGGTGTETPPVNTVSVIQDSLTDLPGVLTTLTVGSPHGGLAVNPNTNRVFVANQGTGTSPGNTISVIQDSSTGLPTVSPTTLTLGVSSLGVSGLDVNPNTNRLYVAGSASATSSGTVTVIQDTSTGPPSVSTTLTIGSFPVFNLVVNPNTNRVFVPNFGTVTTPPVVSVIFDPPPAAPSLSIIAPAPVTVNTDPGLCSATGVPLGTPTVTGGTPPYISTNNAPSTFPLGGTTVTWTVTDSASPPNSAAASQTVTVIDNQIPTIGSLSPVTALVSTSSSVLTPPSSSDNCPGVIVSSDAPATFSTLGIVTIAWTATDAAGNTATSTQTVTVTAPVDFTPVLNAIASSLNAIINAITAAQDAIIASVNAATTSIINAISIAQTVIINAVNSRLGFFATPPGSVVGVNAPAEVTIFEMTNTAGKVSGYVDSSELDTGAPPDRLAVNVYVDITDDGIFNPQLFTSVNVLGRAGQVRAERIAIEPLPVQFGIRITISGIAGDVTDDTIFYQFFVERSGT